MTMSTTQVIGRLVADPEVVNYGTEGKQLVNFRIACNTGKDETQYYNATAFSRTAEIIRDYVKKGQQVFLNGQFKISDYESKKYTDEQGNPAKMRDYTLIVNDVKLLSNQQQDNGSSSSYQSQSQSQTRQQQPVTSTEGFGGFNITDDDLPF